MSRRSLFLAVGIFLVLASAIAAGLVTLIRYEPSVYHEAAVPPGPERQRMSQECTREFVRLVNAVTGEQEEECRFTNEQINSYLEESFLHQGLGEFLPEGIAEPRLIIEPDKVRLAFRYGAGFWSTIISIDMKVWLAKDEPNVIALELTSLKAGALPITAQSLLNSLSERADRTGINFSWYRHHGHRVALLRFQNDKSHANLQLHGLQLEKGAIRIQVGSNDSSPSLRAQIMIPESLLTSKAE